MATNIREVDIRFAIGLIRPNSEYHFRAPNHSGHTLAEALGDWRDPNTTPPTEAEIIAAWDTHVAERASQASSATSLRNQVLTVAGSAEDVLLTDLTAAQVKALVAVLLWKAGGLTNDGHVKALSEWVR